MLSHVTENALYTMIGIVAVLIVATAIQWVLIVKNPGKDYRELRLRTTSWWWMIGLLFGFLAISIDAAIVFFGFISFLALKEFLSIVPTRQADRRVVFWAYLAIPLQYYWVAIGWYGMFIIFIPVYMFLFIPMRMVLRGETEGVYQGSRYPSLGCDVDGILGQSHCIFAGIAGEQFPGWGRRPGPIFVIHDSVQRCQSVCVG